MPHSPPALSPFHDTGRATVDPGIARFLTASDRLDEAAPPGLARWTIGLAGAAVVGFVVWAGVLPLKEIAVGRGEILPTGFSRKVQHLEGGTVARVLVTEGQAVRAGDVVAVMDETAARAELAQAQAHRASLGLSVERLEAFAAGRSVELGTADDPFQIIRRTQRAVLDAQSESRHAQILGLMSEIATRRATLDNLALQVARTGQELDLVRESLARRQGLISRGLVRLAEVEALRRDELRVQGELGRVVTERQAAENAIGGLEAKRAEILARLRADALQELARIHVEIADANAAIERLSDRMRRLQVTAPVAGTVKEVAVRAPAVVAPGGALIEIVPTDAAVLAEIEVSPDDIGYVRRGAPAVVKVSAFDHTRFGSLAASVETVSPTSFKAADGQPYFKLQLRLDGNALRGEWRPLVVTPGMAVTAEVRTGEKTLLAYLLKPIRGAFSTAFAER